MLGTSKMVELSTKARERVHTKPRMDTGRLGRLGRKQSGTDLRRHIGRGQIQMMRSFWPPRIPGHKAITTHQIIGISTMGEIEGSKNSRGWLKGRVWMGECRQVQVGIHPLLIPNVKGRSQSLGAKSTEMEGGSKDTCHTWYAWAYIRLGDCTRDPLQTQLYDEC